MKRVLLSTLVLMISLEARENPFFPSQGEKDLPYTSNLSEKLPQLKRASISLPSEARVIKKVTILSNEVQLQLLQGGPLILPLEAIGLDRRRYDMI